MSSAMLESVIVWPVLILIQALAALPWLVAVGWLNVGRDTLKAGTIFSAIFIVLGVGVGIGILASNAGPDTLTGYGRLYASILVFQLAADLLVLVFVLLLRFASKPGAVALAAFRESVRQPMYWLLFMAGLLLLLISPFLPYFTFGEDEKMLKDLGYMTIMFMAALFGVLAASMSISEEIEGRTAVTVISKPISRRHFLIGKFLGVLMASLLMAGSLSWVMIWTILFKQWWDPPIGQTQPPDPLWVSTMLGSMGLPGAAADVMRGILLWLDSFAGTLPGIVISSCQVMVLIAIAVALATRLPMVVNAPICLVIYFLGHLTPILTAVSADSYKLIEFVARVFDMVLPGLDMFDMGTATIRYAPLPPNEFALYTVYVTLYAVIYTTIALLFGLFLFEDRDLA